jgi:hypothetical protein
MLIDPLANHRETRSHDEISFQAIPGVMELVGRAPDINAGTSQPVFLDRFIVDERSGNIGLANIAMVSELADGFSGLSGRSRSRERRGAKGDEQTGGGE